ncbi:sugar transferase [Polynucleobacter paneuropaeus]|nr:sugar transferase [Polynucleobacter paneuropaeus]
MFKRIFDLLLALVASFLLAPVLFVVYLLVRLTSPGPAIYWSDRIGKRNRIFRMPKFRSMRQDTPILATHLLRNPRDYLSPVGGFIRKTSLDELPQLWSILKGDMSFVGPRPALFNQKDLIERRNQLGVEVLKPGLTGWAQVNGRDELDTEAKVDLDYQYLLYRSFWFDLKILWFTVLKVIRSEGVVH